MNSAPTERFWKLEEIGGKEQQLSPYDEECEAHFNQNTTHDNQVRFVIHLPFRDETS